MNPRVYIYMLFLVQRSSSSSSIRAPRSAIRARARPGARTRAANRPSAGRAASARARTRPLRRTRDLAPLRTGASARPKPRRAPRSHRPRSCRPFVPWRSEESDRRARPKVRPTRNPRERCSRDVDGPRLGVSFGLFEIVEARDSAVAQAPKLIDRVPQKVDVM